MAQTAISTSGSSARVLAVSAHGGAGGRALASQIPFIEATGETFPSGDVEGEPNMICICATETVEGLTRCHDLVLQHLNGLAGNTHLLAIVTRPSQPGWTGRRTPKIIAERLGILEDPNLPGVLVRLDWNAELALTKATDRDEVLPQHIAEWLSLDEKAKKKARKIKGSHAATGILPAAATILTEARSIAAQADS